VTRKLYRGDLRALSDAAHGRFSDINIDRIERLLDRDFLTKSFWGGFRVTVKGRWALLLRSTIAKDRAEKAT
jgi:hypothetical protein